MRKALIGIVIIVKDNNRGIFRLLQQLLIVKVGLFFYGLVKVVCFLRGVSLAEINVFGLHRAIELGEEGGVNVRVGLVG